jgi:hypothetical protein
MKMNKSFIIALIGLFISCTDQGDIVKYAFVNLSSQNLKIIMYDRLGDIDTTSLNILENIVLDKEPPPYDSGPFFSEDSITLVFSDDKRLVYRKLKSKSDCLGSPKNPYCQYSHYLCPNDTCKFIIDNNEYLKAK